MIGSPNEVERLLARIGPHLAELTNRPALVEAEVNTLAAQVAEKRCLITGAGGSIGSSLACLLASHRPRRLVLVDNHENSLFQLGTRLAAGLGMQASVKLALLDVRDGKALAKLMAAERPQLVFHLAAYKHVPLAEEWPAPFADVNVLGGWNVLRLVADHDVESLVYSSTDKAVRPRSVYGATKRAMELALQARGEAPFSNRLVCSRLVNVIGARGGVIETFARQICQGKPLTITDSKMSRYWITEREAQILLLYSGLWQGGSTMLIPNLAEPRTVLSVAQGLWRLLRPNDGPAPIVQTGMRAGEKLSEELTYEHEEMIGTKMSSIVEIRSHLSARPDVTDIESLVARLRSLIFECRDADIEDLLFSFTQEFS